MKNRIVVRYIFAALIGGFFVVSGIGKLLNVEQLIETVQRYGVPSFIAPGAIFLPPLEIVLGLLILFPATRKTSSGLIFVLLVIFTIAYIYAHFFKGVQECGCSGEFSFLDRNLIQLLTVNAILGIGSLILHRTSRSYVGSLARWQKIMVLGVALLSSTAAGASSIEPLVQNNSKWIGRSIHSTPLSQITSTSKDSIYALFFYSMNCTHCWASIENVKGLMSERVVDKVVGFTFGADSSLMKFNRIFRPNFSTNLIPVEKLRTIIRSVPAIFFIRNDTVVYSEEGQVMSPLWYEQYVLKERTIAPF